MLDEPRSRVEVARPSRSPEGRGAAAWSVALHSGVLALLAFVGVTSSRPPAESPLIMAELLTAERASVPATMIDDLTTSPTTTEHTTSEPSPAAEAVPPAEPPAEAPPPAPLPAETSPPPRVAEETPRPAEPTVEQPPQPAPDERVADTLEPPSVPPSEPAAARDSPSEPAAPSRTFASREQLAVRSRLASWTGRFSSDEPASTLTWRDDGQQYTAVLKQVPSADSMGMQQLAVELTTERDGERLVTELRMNRVAFSNFAQFIDRWDPAVAIHDDLIDGRFHSNSEIRVSRDGRAKPVFNGKVTLAASDVRTDGPGVLNRRTMFPGGIETSVRRIALPPRAASFEPSVVPPDRLHRFEREALITFNADGSFDASTVAGDGAVEHGMLGDEPFYLVGADDVALRVRGIVNGKVLVYSPRNIVVVDDLRYADDPRMPGASDYLGLVAERSVEIDEPEVTGSGDLEIQASIYARNRFVVRSYLSRRSGTLNIYGSVAAGSLSATEPRYATKIEFDDRLTTMRAPGFPMSDRYELDTASDEWRVVGAAN